MGRRRGAPPGFLHEPAAARLHVHGHDLGCRGRLDGCRGDPRCHCRSDRCSTRPPGSHAGRARRCRSDRGIVAPARAARAPAVRTAHRRAGAPEPRTARYAAAKPRRHRPAVRRMANDIRSSPRRRSDGSSSGCASAWNSTSARHASRLPISARRASTRSDLATALREAGEREVDGRQIQLSFAAERYAARPVPGRSRGAVAEDRARGDVNAAAMLMPTASASS